MNPERVRRLIGDLVHLATEAGEDDFDALIAAASGEELEMINGFAGNVQTVVLLRRMRQLLVQRA